MESAMSDILSLSDANIRSQDYFVARTRARCRHCGRTTGLLALALSGKHEARVADDSEGWQTAGGNAFVFQVEQLPDHVQARLSRLSRHFRPAPIGAAGSSTWTNHCEHCGAVLEEQDLHCEPGGAFMPSNETAAARIQLLQMREPFEAVAAGYALEPQYFHFMRRG
jgi:hypothetical protein